MIGCLVLAAGGSRRMGRPKQLLPYRNGTLLDHAVRQVQGAALAPVIVVVGAGADAIRASSDHASIHFAENPEWQTGMGSSITTGLRELLAVAENVAGFGIALVDQPFIHSVHLRAMADDLLRGQADVVVAQYSGTLGAPAFFARKTFTAILQLSPEAGAKKLFNSPAWTVRRFSLPEAARDIDTPEDFAGLTHSGC